MVDTENKHVSTANRTASTTGAGRLRLAKAGAVIALSAALCAAPFAAHAVSGTASDAASDAVASASSASTSAQSQDAPSTQTYDYAGTYSAVATADGTEEVIEAQEVAATEANQNVALAQNGGTMRVASAALAKSGDGADENQCNFYGVNSVVLAVGQASRAVLSNTALTATSQGSNALFATNGGTALAQASQITTSADSSRGLDATYGGTIMANELLVQTSGAHSAAIATDRGGGNVSLTNSTLQTAGEGSPLLYSTGDIEIDNVSGKSAASQLVGLEGLNTVLIANSTLESTATKATASDPVANGVIIYQSTSGDADTATGKEALFQASDSTLKSSIQSGTLFYLTNTTADIVLSNVNLDFDDEKAKLLTAAGNNANDWGTAGKNGATVTLTALDQQLQGDIEIDSISSLDLYLLEGSKWTGASSITSNSSGADLASNIAVSIDSTSGWTLTQDATVSDLNIEKGGSLVDENGKAVVIVDADGNKLVDGASSIKVTVTGEFSTTVKTTDQNELRASAIDRTAFDAEFGTQTAFGANGNSASTAEEARIAELQQIIINWFSAL